MREIEDRHFRVVVLEKSTESIVDGEKDKHMDYREHQTGMDTGVNGAKGCFKLLWARVESRRVAMAVAGGRMRLDNTM